MPLQSGDVGAGALIFDRQAALAGALPSRASLSASRTEAAGTISSASPSGSLAETSARAWPRRAAGADQDLDFRRKIQQSQQVSDMAARLVDELAQFLLGVAIILDEAAIGLRFLDRVQILALDILDQGDFERLLVAELADDGGDFVQPRLLRRAPAPLAGDDLEAMAVRTDDDRLDDASRLDRLGELGQRFLVEDAARLARMWLDARDRDHLHRAAGGRALRPVANRRLLLDLAEQGGEAAAEPRGPFLREGIAAHAASAFWGRRSISSRASAI